MSDNRSMDEQTPIIPPAALLGVSLLGLLVALVVALTQPEFSVVGWGGLALAIISLLAWALMAPEQVVAIFRGRTARFGGTALVVTLVFIVMLVAVYVLLREQNLRLDVSQANTFSMSQEVRDVITTLAADPTLPDVRILAFYSVNQAAQRDRDIVLFDDYVAASSGKISYEFVDPDRQPTLAELYGARGGDIVVVPLVDGQPNVDGAETVPPSSQDAFQQELTVTIMRVSALGDFRAYFLSVTDGLLLEDPGLNGLSQLGEALQSLRWTTQQVSFLDLASPESELVLNDPAADADVLVIPGGSQRLPQEQLQIITDYLDAGGNLVLFADTNLAGDESLATAADFSDYLYENFGLRVNADTVLDNFASFQSPLNVIVTDLDPTNYATAAIGSNQGMLFSLTHSIEVAPNLPPHIRVTVLARTGDTAYSKTGLDFRRQLTSADVARADSDPRGPFVVAAAAENTSTGARVVVFGSRSIPINQYALFADIRNVDAAFGAIAWSTGFDAFVQNIPPLMIAPPAPSQAPLFASDQQVNLVGSIAVVFLPFSILVVGLIVWWLGRERQAVVE